MNLFDCSTRDAIARARSIACNHNRSLSLGFCLAALISLTGTALTVRAGDAPSSRIDYALCYFPPAGGVVMHGGWGEPNWEPLAEMWKLDASGWQQITVPGTPALAHHSMTYDAARQELVVCGRIFYQNTALTIWTFDGTAWLVQTNLSGINNGGGMVAYDSDRQRVVLYWAQDSFSGTNQETWESDGTTWVKLNPAQKPARCADSALLKYDPTLHRTVLVAYPDYNSASVQTWTWDGTNWVQIKGAQPANAYTGSMAYDQSRKQLTLLATDQETWTFNGSDWTKLASAHSPDYYYLGYFSLEYDPVRQVSVFFSGEGHAAAADQTLSYPQRGWQLDTSDWKSFSDQVTATQTNGMMLLSWAADATGYTLETSGTLPGSWQTVPGVPFTNGNQLIMTNPISGAAQFFRLKRP